MPIDAKAHVCEACGICYIRPGGPMRHRCRRHGESTPNGTNESPRLPCGESPRHMTGCRGLKRLRARHGTRAERRALPGPGLMLTGFLLELTRHAPGPPPASRTAGATANALEQDAGRRLPGSRRAAHTQVGVVPMAQDVLGEGTRKDKKSRLSTHGPIRRPTAPRRRPGFSRRATEVG